MSKNAVRERRELALIELRKRPQDVVVSTGVLVSDAIDMIEYRLWEEREAESRQGQDE